MSLTVIKASGTQERFKIQKLVDSLIRSGASKETAWTIARKVEAQTTPGSHTKHIYRMAKKLLKKYNSVYDMRYSLKNAMYTLGPAGYRFEKFFAGILREYGYSAETNRFIKGHCVTHEVDVFAKKEENTFVIECKYHSRSGNATDLKTALYIHSRVEDIKKAFSMTPTHAGLTHQGWLVTNTRCTSDAIGYAECVGLKIVSWKYPKKGSLEKMIEDKGLYPVTALSSVKKHALEALFQRGIIFAKDIAEMSEAAFLSSSGLDAGLARILKKEADRLCARMK